MGRLATGRPRKYQIMELWDRHHTILRLLALGLTPKVIAEQVGCTVATVSNVARSELGKRQLRLLNGAADKLTVDILEDIKNLAPLAVAKLEEILSNDDSDKKLVANVAQDILDRAGYGAPKVIQGNFTHAHLTKEDIEVLKARAQAIVAPTSDDCIDTYIED